MKQVSFQSALTLCFAFSGMAPYLVADDRAPTRPTGAVRSPAKSPVQPATTPAKLAAKPSQPPVRQVQLDSHGRYPYGQFLGGYRYPFQYPFYRNRPRHYPFGVGPYGPYGSNYGGYSGNAYDPGVYGSPVPIAPDAPAPALPPGAPIVPLPGEAARGPAAGAPQVLQPGASNVARGDKMLDSGMQAQLTPSVIGPAYGDPGQFPGGSPFNPGYGAAQTFRAYPFGYYGDQMWFGNDHLVYGFGMYPIPNYSYFAGPPAGFNVAGPEIYPQYFNYAPRNFGPYNPGIGGLNGNSGLMQGW